MVAMAEKKPKKPTGGKHKTPRKPMFLPEEWDVVARDLAGEDEMPKLWYVIKLLKSAAEAKGRTNLPRPPWIKSPSDPE